MVRRRRRKKRRDKRTKDTGVRVKKLEQMKKVKGWQTPDLDWENTVSRNLDGLIDEMKKGYNIDEETTKVLTKTVMKRVKLYQEIAELTGVNMIQGESLWAIQYEYIFQRQLFAQDTTKEESIRDLNVHNLKYIIEQNYNRRGNPDFEELKLKEFKGTDLEDFTLTGDKGLLEKEYLNQLEQRVQLLRKEMGEG